MKFNVGLLQLAAKDLDQKSNLEKGVEACHKAKELGADLALFPEVWNIGYAFCKPDKKQEWEEQAIDQQSEFFQTYVHLAKELEMNIAITYLERFSPKPRNTVSVIKKSGEVVLDYSKVFLCNFGQEELQKKNYNRDDVGTDYNCSPGTEFNVCDLENEHGSVKVGAMICADREFPEATTALMKKGAEIIIVPNSCAWDEVRDCQLKTRAFDNFVGVAMTNYPRPKNNGQSVAYSPLALSGNPLIVKAGEQEEIVLAGFDLDAIRNFRKEEQWRLDYRMSFGN